MCFLVDEMSTRKRPGQPVAAVSRTTGIAPGLVGSLRNFARGFVNQSHRFQQQDRLLLSAEFRKVLP